MGHPRVGVVNSVGSNQSGLGTPRQDNEGAQADGGGRQCDWHWPYGRGKTSKTTR